MTAADQSQLSIKTCDQSEESIVTTADQSQLSIETCDQSEVSIVTAADQSQLTFTARLRFRSLAEIETGMSFTTATRPRLAIYRGQY